MERRAEKLGDANRPLDEEGKKQQMAEEDKDFVRFYAIWWIGILILLFLVVSLAIVDIWATRRYAWAQLRRISSEHREVLERDLAMHRQQKLNSRMRDEVTAPRSTQHREWRGHLLRVKIRGTPESQI